MNKFARAFIILVCGLLVVLAMSLPVFADGEYGQAGGGQPSEQPKEAVHSTVNAGVGDNLLLISLGAVGIGALCLVISKLTRGVSVWN
jgi:hypothetical protein